MTAPDRGATYQIALASTGSSTHDAWYLDLDLPAQRRRELFSKMTRQRIRRGVFRSIADPQAATILFISPNTLLAPKPLGLDQIRPGHTGQTPPLPFIVHSSQCTSFEALGAGSINFLAGSINFWAGSINFLAGSIKSQSEPPPTYHQTFDFAEITGDNYRSLLCQYFFRIREKSQKLGGHGKWGLSPADRR